ncbi:ankyrin repeat-containing domain protein, partial [Immersiella caudata]
DILQRLVSAGHDINALIIPYSTTPLLAAAMMNNCIIIPHLLRYGADLNHQDKEGDTALTEAIYNHSHEALRTLVAHGANYRLRSKSGETILHLLARYGDLRMLEIIAEAKL